MKQSIYDIARLAVTIIIGVAGGLLLFNSWPQTQTGAGPAPTPFAVSAAASVGPTATLEANQPQDAYCVGGSTTIAEARKRAGFKILEPGYVPDGLQLSDVSLNRMFSRREFNVHLHFSNLVIRALEPYVTIDQYPLPLDYEWQLSRREWRSSPITIHRIQGQFLEYVVPTPMPPGTIPPNPTLTAFASGRVTIVPQTARPQVPCAWNVIQTPIPWTPTPIRTQAARAVTSTPTPRSWQPSNELRWTENNVHLVVTGTYDREELLKVAESLK